MPSAALRIAGTLGLAAVLFGCGGPRAVRRVTDVTEIGRSTSPQAGAWEETVGGDREIPVRRGRLARPGASSPLDPSILLPATPARDRVVARVGDIVIHESQVFERLLDGNRRAALDLVDVLVMDAVIALQADRHEVSVEAEEIDALVASEEEILRERVRIEWGTKKSFEQYVAEQFDLGVEEYRRFLRLELARERYRSHVIRFLDLLEDRVEVRILVNRDAQVVSDAADRVREGADFATLAFRHSEDETRSDGGRMPPFGRAFDHPIARVAFGLAEGELSEVFEMEVDGSPHHALVYCLRRVPGRKDVSYADVADEIRRGLEERALTPFELQSFALRWCADAVERLPSEATGR